MNLRTNEKDIIAKEGYPIIGGGLAAAALFYKLGSKPIALTGCVFSLFSLYFFRNPTRKPPENKDAVVSPADGEVIAVGNYYERYFLKREVKRVSVFMSLLDVHINRSPVDGKIISVVHKKGEFLAAFKEKASLVNEQTAILIEPENRKEKIVVVQIAGLVARRVVTYSGPEDRLKKGDIFGMIKFGSRLDIYVEGNFEEVVSINQKVKAGESILGFLR